MFTPIFARLIVDEVFVPSAPESAAPESAAPESATPESAAPEALDAANTGEAARLLALFLVGIAGVTTLRAASIYGRNSFLELYSQRVLRDLRQRMYEHIQSLSFEFFHRTRTGELMARMTSDMEAIRGLLVLGIMHGAVGLFYVVASATILFSINVPLALVSLAATPFLAVTTVRFRQAMRPRFQAIRDQHSRLNAQVQENISGIRVVLSFMRSGFELEKFRQENHGLTLRRNEAVRVWARAMPLIEFFSGIATALMLFFGGMFVVQGQISLGTWVQFNGYLWMLVLPMRMLGDLVNQYSLSATSAARVFEILDEESTLPPPANPKRPKRLSGEVEFRNVVWRPGGRTVLDGVSLHVPPGSTVAVMGATGSGKSSLVNLLTRFYDPDEGEVLVDGIPVRDMDLATLRSNIALVAQETFLFSETMYNNLTYGRRGAPIEYVRHVAAQTQAHEFIRSMSDGYDTVVGERGVGLSGGQKQRASIARALVKGAPILVLDDSTSSVDMETEGLIHDALRDLAGKTTTFVIAHRISTVKDADQIIVLDEGRIVQRGTHDELAGSEGPYREILLVQHAANGKGA